MKRRIVSSTSRTAQMTCLFRACSAMERNHYYRSGDHVAPSLLPAGLRILLHLSPARWFFSKMLAPRGIYEYVVARTKYIDAAFKQALEDRFDQVLIFGAGFDTRALRLQDAAGSTRGKRRLYHGEDEIAKMVSRANEPWHFGIEKGRVQEFLAGYSMRLTDHRDANALEQAYFKTPSGETIGRVNGTHCLVTAETC